MSCGQPLAAPKPVERPGGQPAYQPAGAYPAAIPQKNKWLWPTAIGLMAILAFLIFAAAKLLSSNAPEAHLTAPGHTASVPLVAGEPTMPQDVKDWLEHLRETEDRKNKLSNEQVSKVMIEFTKLNGLGGAYGALDKNDNLDPDQLQSPTTRLGEKLGDLRQPWKDLIQFFESDPPPAECRDLAHTYDDALDEVSGEMGDLGDMLSGNSSDPQAMIQKLESLRGQSSNTIDQEFKVSDDMVSNLCQKYHVSKWFKIEADSGSSMALGGGGLSGLPDTDSGSNPLP